jgi:tRNA(fMet)-specific endonuclease VapC
LGRRAGCCQAARRGGGAVLNRLLLDTTFLIDAERAGDDLDELIADEDDVAIAAITVAELRVGVELSGGRHRTRRRAFVDDIVEAIPVQNNDLPVSAAHAELLVAVRKQGVPRGALDLMVAATAKASNRTVVTADTAAFRDLPGLSVRGHR